MDGRLGTTVIGTVHWGANNIFSVQPDEGSLVECRLKGKVLKDVEETYNPLSPGDRVELELDAGHPGKAMILSRLPRKNAYHRWNKKGDRPQTLAANLDELILVTSPASPPFRPRFLDRALVMAQREELNALIVVNKCDQKLTENDEDRLATFQDLGWDVHLCSALTGEGIAELKEHLVGSTTALVGQSGVGKSSLLNVLYEGSKQRTGEISAKYNRGSHTTNVSVYFPWAEGGGVIDTPGVRELEVFGVDAPQLAFLYPDFAPYLGQCAFSICTHIQEPGCAVLKALEAGNIHPDRWENYRKLFLELKEAAKWT
jgi:ribosome biogenesis GTPase